jgi:hypothetical protein
MVAGKSFFLFRPGRGVKAEGICQLCKEKMKIISNITPERRIGIHCPIREHGGHKKGTLALHSRSD